MVSFVLQILLPGEYHVRDVGGGHVEEQRWQGRGKRDQHEARQYKIARQMEAPGWHLRKVKLAFARKNRFPRSLIFARVGSNRGLGFVHLGHAIASASGRYLRTGRLQTWDSIT